MYNCDNGIITGIFGLAGTLVGGVITFLAQCYYEYRKEKKDDRNKLSNLYEKMKNDIRVIDNTAHLLLFFMDADISKLDDFEIDEWCTQFHSQVKECSLLWDDFRTIIIKYIPKIRTKEKFNLLEKVMELINYEYMGTILDKMIKPTLEMLLARQEALLENKKDISEVRLLLKEIKKEYFKIIF